MATVTWSDHAMERMREQARYISEQACSSEIAWEWANDIFAEADGLADFPDAPYREILVRKNFRLIYRREGDVCYIVTIRRCSMLLDEGALMELDSIR